MAGRSVGVRVKQRSWASAEPAKGPSESQPGATCQIEGWATEILRGQEPGVAEFAHPGKIGG